MRSRTGGRRNGAAWMLLALAVLCAFPALMQSTEGGSTGKKLAEQPEGGCQVLLFTEEEGETLLAYSGPREGAVLAVDPVTGTEEYRADFSCPLFWAAPRGGSLFVLEQGSGFPVLTRLSIRLEEEKRQTLPAALDSFTLFDCSAEGKLWGVRADAGDTLTVWGPEGEEARRQFSGPVEFLHFTPAGTLFVYAGGELFRGTEGEPDLLEPLPCMAAPAALLGEEFLLDRDGMVCRMSGDRTEPVLRCPGFSSLSVFPCLDRRNRLILSEGGSLFRVSLEGDPLGNCRVDGTLLGIAPQGALYRKENALYYARHGFEEDSEPSPSPTPSLPPDFSQVPGALVNGTFLTLTEGGTVQELLELLRPGFAVVRDAAGKTVASGPLATGMTVGGYTVVIPGDCTGTGRVNSADVRAAHAHILGTALLPGEAYRRAADLNGDGAVTGADLVLLGAAVLW